jgi:plasmid stabilization system protein ParE
MRVYFWQIEGKRGQVKKGLNKILLQFCSFDFTKCIRPHFLEVPGLGARFLAEIERCLDLLLDAPLIGTPLRSELRNFPLNDSFPFSLVYAVRREILFIVAVAHQSRKPGYWRSRTAR